MKVCCPVDLLFRSAFWLFVLLIFQIFCLFVRLLFLALVFVLFAALVAHGVPPLVLPVILSVRVTGSLILMMNAIRSMSRRQGREWVGRAISYQRNILRRYMAIINLGIGTQQYLRLRIPVSYKGALRNLISSMCSMAMR